MKAGETKNRGKSRHGKLTEIKKNKKKQNLVSFVRSVVIEAFGTILFENKNRKTNPLQQK